MPNIQVCSSVTVVDQLDIGNLQSYLTCNQEATVIMNPSTGECVPDWSDNNVVITPVISYNGTPLQLDNAGLRITYRRRDGGSTPTSLIPEVEVVQGNILHISDNVLVGSVSGLLTYICDISYTDPNFSSPITAQNTLTFSLINNAPEIQDATISGGSTFLYNAQKEVVGLDSIILNATISNVQILKWQYYNPDSGYIDFPTTYNDDISSDTLAVYEDERDIWIDNRTAMIKLVTSNPDVYDIHQIFKLYDGNPNIYMVLSNQTHYVPCNNQGEVLSLEGAQTQVYIYKEGVDVTSEWQLNCQQGPGIAGMFVGQFTTENASQYGLYTPGELIAEATYVDFTATKDGNTLTARYTISKARGGIDGEAPYIYELEPNTYIMNMDEQGVLSPKNVIFTSYLTRASTIDKTAYAGILVIDETVDGVTYRNIHTSRSPESTFRVVPSSKTVTSIRGRLYDASNTKLLDEQSVVITRDGISGVNGIDGTAVGLSNYQDVIPCSESGAVAGARDISIPYYAFAGITRLKVHAEIIAGLVRGLTRKSNTDGTATSDGLLVLHFDNGADLGGANNLTGEVKIRLSIETADGKKGTVDQVYRWTKNIRAVDGESAHFLQIYSDDGGVIKNEKDTTTLKLRYMEGNAIVTPTTVQWYKLKNGKYTSIQGATTQTLTLTADDVEDYAFYKVTATYKGATNEAYYGVDDISDPIIVSTMASVQEFIDGQGCGAVYTRVFRNGEELDPIKSTTFSDTPPVSAKNGDYYYYLNPADKTVTLKRHNGVMWVNETENNLFSYEYFLIDNNGKEQETTYKQRCVYIDPTVVGDSMQFICEVNERG